MVTYRKLYRDVLSAKYIKKKTDYCLPVSNDLLPGAKVPTFRMNVLFTYLWQHYLADGQTGSLFKTDKLLPIISLLQDSCRHNNPTSRICNFVCLFLRLCPQCGLCSAFITTTEFLCGRAAILSWIPGSVCNDLYLRFIQLIVTVFTQSVIHW